MTTRKRAAPRARVTRPVIDRDGPDRRPSGFLRGAAGLPGMSAAQRVIESSVPAAYRVIQEYLLWGQRAAAQCTPFPTTRPTMRNRSHEPADPGTQFFEMWQQMYMQWMSMFMPGMAGMPNMMPNMMANMGMGMGMGMGELELELVSGGRTAKVRLRMRRAMPGGGLGGGKAELHADRGDDTLAVEVGERGGLRLQVSAKQADGRYQGELQDRYGGVCGELEVTLSS